MYWYAIHYNDRPLSGQPSYAGGGTRLFRYLTKAARDRSVKEFPTRTSGKRGARLETIAAMDKRVRRAKYQIRRGHWEQYRWRGVKYKVSEGDWPQYGLVIDDVRRTSTPNEGD